MMNITIQRNRGVYMAEMVSVPLYQQIKEDIKDAIQSGKYKPKEKIPPEPVLSEEYAVSRITVRRAVEELCSEGYLTKMQGRGTFVNTPRINRKFTGGDKVEGFSQTCRKLGLTPGARVVDRRIVPARHDEQEFFGLGSDSLLIYVERVRTADGQPIFLENLFLPYEEYKTLLSMDLSNVSMFETIAQVSGHGPANIAHRTVEVTRASLEQSQHLSIPLGEPMLFLNVYFLDEAEHPNCIGRQYYIGSRYMFEI